MKKIKPGPKGPRLKKNELKRRKLITLSPKVDDWLVKQKNQSAIVEQALINQHNIKL